MSAGLLESSSPRPHEDMAIANLTPNSFSDGGRLASPEDVWSLVAPWVEAGVRWLDLGAESARPGATPVAASDEWERLAPTLEYLSTRDLGSARISIDSRHPTTQSRAVDYPMVAMINCVDGVGHIQKTSHLRDLLAKNSDLHYVAMHMHGTPSTMQQDPLGEQCLPEVSSFFNRAHKVLRDVGFSEDHIWLDPGIGFGKTKEACWQLVGYASQFGHHYPLCYGFSRKSFLVKDRSAYKESELDALTLSVAKKLLVSHASLPHPLMIRTHNPLALLQELAEISP